MARSSYTDEQFTEFASRDIVFGSYTSMDIYEEHPVYIQGFLNQFVSALFTTDRDETNVNASIRVFHTLQRFAHENKRIIGLINKENHDGSYNISLLGDDYTFNIGNAPVVSLMQTATSTGIIEDDKCINMNIIPYWGENCIIELNDYARHYEDITNEEVFDPPYDTFDFVPRWERTDQPAFYNYFSESNGVGSTQGNATISRDKNATFNVGCANWWPYITGSFLEYIPFMSGEIYQRIAGNIANMIDVAVSVCATAVEGSANPGYYDMTEYNPMPGCTLEQCPASPEEYEIWHDKWFAGFFKPYNLIMTHDEAQAIEYLKTGRIPSDAEIFPWDPDSFPKYENPSDPGDDEGQGEDEPNESDDPEDNPSDFGDTPDGNPDFTPQKLTNNNLYWLSAGQLHEFLNWFWTDAGEVADLESLWQKIQGLFNDLASAIINVRYMPVNPAWIGGVVPTSSIVVGMITHTPQSQVMRILSANPSLQTIARIPISEVIDEIKTAKGFTNYSPYAQCSLYLPFHGFIDLDNDLLMGSVLKIKALYDIITGTIQYLLYREEGNTQTLINTIPCKMAVDIPITLQSKGERDSAIFQNVASVGGNAISSIIGLASGNPIGAVMGVSSFAQGLANAGTQSAPMSVKGSVQETGAFFAPNKVCIYIERPIYNRPKIYKSRLGYPCNKGYTLSSDKITGFTQCASPRITFTETTPLQEEIDEIYSYLEKGVII